MRRKINAKEGEGGKMRVRREGKVIEGGSTWP